MATLNIDGTDHNLEDFPIEVQNLIQVLTKAEGEHNDQLYALNKTAIFIQAIRKEALERAQAHLGAPALGHVPEGELIKGSIE